MSKIIMVVEHNQMNYCPVCGDPKNFIEYGRYGNATLHCENCDTHFQIMRIKS